MKLLKQFKSEDDLFFQQELSELQSALKISS